MASVPSGSGLPPEQAAPEVVQRDSRSASRARPRALMSAPLSAYADHARSVPAGVALQLVRLVKRWNVSAEQLLAALGLCEEQLEEPLARLPIDIVSALISRARDLTREPGLGFYLGLDKRVTSYGYLGFAAMSAASLREALELTIRFVPAQTVAFSVRMEELDQNRAALIYEPHVDFGSVEDVLLFDVVVSLWQIGSALTGKELSGLTELTIDEPPYYHRFSQLLPQVRFGQSVTRLIFDAQLLDLPLVSADRATLRLASEQCQAALDALIADSSLAQRVRALVSRASDSPVSLARAAAALRISPRTLKRKLSAHGVSFSELLADTRRETALELLRTSSLSVDAIAKRLGYSTPPNFIRAFRRWTGQTPTAYRRRSTETEPPDPSRLPSTSS